MAALPIFPYKWRKHCFSLQQESHQIATLLAKPAVEIVEYQDALTNHLWLMRTLRASARRMCNVILTVASLSPLTPVSSYFSLNIFLISNPWGGRRWDFRNCQQKCVVLHSDRVIMPVLWNSQKKNQPVEYSVLAVLLNVRRMRKECSWRNGCQSNVDSLNKHWFLVKGWLKTHVETLCPLVVD